MHLILTDNITLPKVQTLSPDQCLSCVADTCRRSDHKPITGIHVGNTAYVVFTKRHDWPP